jgi:hypothetical protein
MHSEHIPRKLVGAKRRSRASGAAGSFNFWLSMNCPAAEQRDIYKGILMPQTAGNLTLVRLRRVKGAQKGKNT